MKVSDARFHPLYTNRFQNIMYLRFLPGYLAFATLQAQGERADNNTLRAENERIRGENLAIREALKYVLCSNCGGPPPGETSFEEQQRLRLENARLKEEVLKIIISFNQIERKCLHFFVGF